MRQQLELSIGQHSSAGRKSINQDFHGALVPKEPHLSSKGIAVALADGISSSNVSQIASETAITSFLHDYYSTSDAWSVRTSAQRVLKATNSWLYAQTSNSPHRYNKDKGYICTFSGMVFKSNTAHLFHSGDSRIYRMAGETLQQLTQDHRNVVSADTSHLTRALGFHGTLELDYLRFAITLGDVFILATDGVYEFLTHQTLIEKIGQSLDLDQAAEAIVAAAHAAGSDDNLTIQIVRVENLPAKIVPEVQRQIDLLPLAPLLGPGVSFDGYQIIRDLYISARSHVYLAQDEASGETVVIKVPSVEKRDDREYLETFLMEDWIAKRVDNPHVLKAIESTRPRNFLYIVTEYIEGQTLAQWIADNPKPDITTVRGIAMQIAKGLQAFHRQEMVHQDLRPNNIMIDPMGTVKIIDFGATKVAGVSEVTERNEGLVGTAQFAAPEYFLGLPGTPLSDQYSLGVIVYSMLTGKLPYGNAVAKTRTHRAQHRLLYQPLRRGKDNDIPGWVDHAVRKATQIDPAKRYAEVAEFVYELSKPSPDYLAKAKPPLMERNPVLFWQCISVILVCALVYQSFS